MRRYPRIAAHAGDAGSVVFAAASAVIAFTAVVEFYRPGTAASYLPPQGLFTVALAGGLLSLAAPRTIRRTAFQRFVLMGTAVLATFIAGTAGWRYFGPLDGMRLPLTAAAVLITGLTFAAMGRVAENDNDV